MDRELSRRGTTRALLVGCFVLDVLGVGCQGTGLINEPDVSVSPQDVDFETVIIGTTHSADISLANTGGATLTVDSVAMDDGGVGFTIESYSGNISGRSSPEDPASFVELTLTFHPQEVGGAEDVVVITSNDPDEPIVEIPVRAVDVTGADFRAIHTGVNSENLFGDVYNLFLDGDFSPLDDYLEFLDRVGATWVGLSVAPIFDASLETAELQLLPIDGGCVNTWDDTVLEELIDRFHEAGLRVYLTIALAANEPNCEGPFRACLGWTEPVGCEDIYTEEQWWWNPDHPDYTTNVGLFWDSYIDVAEHYADIAARHEVEMFSIGTETGGLFRYHPDRYGNFNAEIDQLISAVRAIYPRGTGYWDPMGYLTYDMHYSVYVLGEEENLYLWNNDELDVIGVSAYIPILEYAGQQAPRDGDAPLDPSEYRDAWDYVYTGDPAIVGKLEEIHEIHPDKPIVFLEMGYISKIWAGEFPEGYGDVSAYSQDCRPPHGTNDVDGNAEEDGEQTQRDILESYFDWRGDDIGAVYGAFLWSHYPAQDWRWDDWSQQYCLMGVRSWLHVDQYGNTSDGYGNDYVHDLSESAVEAAYASWPGY